jgi:hypothetical protein
LNAVGETKYTGVVLVRKYARISEMPRSVVEVSGMGPILSLLRARVQPSRLQTADRELVRATVAAPSRFREIRGGIEDEEEERWLPYEVRGVPCARRCCAASRSG